MKTLFIALLLASAAVALNVRVAVAQEGPSLLVSPAWLAQHLGDSNLVLLHVGDRDDFGQAHIPGAQYISLNDISVPDMSQPHDMSAGHLMLELPPIEKLTSAFESRGISSNSRIVVYFGEDEVSQATRVIWTLAYYGLGDRTSLLDGGLGAWHRAGQPVTSENTPPARGQLIPHLHPEFFADAAWVSAHLHQSGISLIDARGPQSYSGDGHVPGAQNVPIEVLVGMNGELKDSASLTGIFGNADVKSGDQVVSYCYIGQRATLVWFVARLLGHPARMYDGSWQDWSSRADLPVQK